MKSSDVFELKATDMGGRIGSLKTKTSEFETPALLPVIHPVRQLVPCKEIKQMGYEAVMTNAYTTFRMLSPRASEGIHRLIDYDGSVMTDSGGYQVLEFGSVDISPKEMALFQEKIGSDIAVVLDEPTGLKVTRNHAERTVRLTLQAAKVTRDTISRDDVIWTLPLQGGRYSDLVSKSARAAARLDFGCYALGSPVEVMEEYDFPLLVEMIAASKERLPENRPFHLFGAGHPLVLPLAISLGCDMFDSASYMLYAKHDRYISRVGTIRLEELEYLGCSCKVCASFKAIELRSLKKEERTIALAKHNLFMLKQVIEETKQAMWEGRLWEYVQVNSRKHPRLLEAFRKAISLKTARTLFERGTPVFKDRGLFISDQIDLERPEIYRYREHVSSLDLSKKSILLIVPETRTKPFLRSKIYQEVAKIISSNERILVTSVCPNFGLIPAEISDIYPLSQTTRAFAHFPKHDMILHRKKWDEISILLTSKHDAEEWLKMQLSSYFGVPMGKTDSKFSPKKRKETLIQVSKSYRSFKRKVALYV